MNRKLKLAILATFVFVLLAGFTGAATPALAAKVVTLTVASTGTTDTAWYRSAVPWKEELEKTGLFKINLKFNGVLGGEREGCEAVQMGTIECVWVSDVGLSAVVPEIAYTNLPYTFSSYEQVDKYYYNGFVGEDVRKKLEAKGFKFMGFCENDFRGLTVSSKPVSSPADLKGMKIRVPEVPIYIELFNKLGAQPTPMAVTELATALQQRTVDGQDNGILLTRANGYYQLQKYMTLTNHIYNAGAILMNPQFFASLEEEYAKVLEEITFKYADIQVKMNREDVSRFLKEIEDYGVQVTVLTPEQMAEFVKIGHDCWSQAEKTFGKEWIDRLKNEIK